MTLKYPDGTQLEVIRGYTPKTYPYLKKGNIITVSASKKWDQHSAYHILEAGKDDGWGYHFIEDETRFKLAIVSNWRERIEPKQNQKI